MDKLISIVNHVLTGQLSCYNKLHMRQQDSHKVVQLYKKMPPKKQTHYLQLLHKKLTTQQQSYKILNILILYNDLYYNNLDLNLKNIQNILTIYQNKNILYTKKNVHKSLVAQNYFILFYLRYLKQRIFNNKAIIFNNLNLNDLKQSLVFCEAALNSMKIILNHDFIINYILTHSTLQPQSKTITSTILKQASEDLSFLIKFIDKWHPTISQNTTESLEVNTIYQQLIYINKNIKKLQTLATKIQLPIKFPRYLINEALNKTIQQSMLTKDSLIRSTSIKKHPQIRADNYQQDQITQCQIFNSVKL